MDLKTSYTILGIAPDVDASQAKQAYKAQVRRWHPDQFPDGSATQTAAQEQLKQINIAYARVKSHLAAHRPRSAARPSDHPAGPSPAKGAKAAAHSWVNHLFKAFGVFAGGQADHPSAASPQHKKPDQGQPFGEILEEMASRADKPARRRQSAKTTVKRRRKASVVGPYRRGGNTVGGISPVEPIKPVSRVRGIGKPR